MNIKSSKIRNAIQGSVAKMIRRDIIPQEQYEKMISIYPVFTIGISYAVGDTVRYNQSVYEVIQQHISQDGWYPDIVPALFKKVEPKQVIPLWVRPTGSHDAYRKGDKSIYNGLVWESIIDNNVWSPDEYGWVLVK